MKYLVFLMLFFPFACKTPIKKGKKASIIQKKPDNKQADRSLASYRPAPLGSSSSSKTIQQAKKELLEALQDGRVVVSKAIIVKNKKPVCYINTINKRGMVPNFAQPASRSSIVVKRGFPVCGARQKKRLASSTSGMVPTGTQLAWAPIAVGGAALTGCLMGLVIEGVKDIHRIKKGLSKSYEDKLPEDFRQLFRAQEMVLEATLGWVVGVSVAGGVVILDEAFNHNPRYPLDRIIEMRKGLKGMGIIGLGAASGLFGALICGKSAVYLLERSL